MRRLRERIRSSEELYLRAARMLAELDASLEARRAMPRRLGYLTDRGPGPWDRSERSRESAEAYDRHTSGGTSRPPDSR